ncbi:hypothetical protein IVA80_27545 [Bradyrhizobium sp. 139]|uniref:hypothetical protein n=1 Tax=Bradyrhizobium sp. 139 TaxID=2782616 RepID=UPI001FFBAE6D|nr:hypothetical protein [Bradyrhizobium sp. 139]MCK1744467.1 hypothetical protein [Bradyrhizobium sp. 139]
MAPDNSAAVISLRQAAPKAMTAAQRAKAYRDRKRTAKLAPADAEPPRPTDLPESSGASTRPLAAVTAHVTPRKPLPVTPARVTSATQEPHVTLSRRQLVPVLLNAAACCLAVVGLTINGWFARSLGASDVAGWLFLALGIAADLIALVMPSCAAGLWHARRLSSLVGWVLWLVTFVFAVTAGLGFASTNISDVTLARSSRVTPAVTAAQASLSDAVSARDRECRGGVGKFCRDREAVVLDRRRVLDAAMAAVEQMGDPQADAAIRLTAWVSFGALRPSSEDFAMVRLILLVLLPQMGGLLIMIGRQSARSASPAKGTAQV